MSDRINLAELREDVACTRRNMGRNGSMTDRDGYALMLVKADDQTALIDAVQAAHEAVEEAHPHQPHSSGAWVIFEPWISSLRDKLERFDIEA